MKPGETVLNGKTQNLDICMSYNYAQSIINMGDYFLLFLLCSYVRFIHGHRYKSHTAERKL